MREELAALFPLDTVGKVTDLFRIELTSDEEPNLVLLSIITGCIENNLTLARKAKLNVSACARVCVCVSGLWQQYVYVYTFIYMAVKCAQHRER